MTDIDLRPGFYYVSAIDGARSARVRGPFALHADALAAVAPSRAKLLEVDPRGAFYAIGTCRCATDLGPGFLDALETS